MNRFVYQLTSSRRLFPATSDWGAYVLARMLRRAPATCTPAGLRKRTFRLRGVHDPVVLRPQMHDFAAAREIFQSNDYHEPMEAADSNASFVLDLGANVGMAVRLWQETFPAVAIAAIEPDPENVAICRENVALGPAPERVRVFAAAAAAETGTLYLRNHGNSLSHWTSSTGDAETTAVPAISIADVLEAMGNPPVIDLMKCDIEGGERQVFADCRSWIDRVRVLVIEVHGKYRLDDFRADLARNGSDLELRGAAPAQPRLQVAWFSRPGLA